MQGTNFKNSGRNGRAGRVIGGALATATVAAAFLAPSADASAGYQSARFKVTITGTQNVTYSGSHADAGRCDISYTSDGSEKLKFKTKPIIVDAFLAPGQKRPVLVSGGTSVFNPVAKTTITRTDNYNPGPLGPDDMDCADGEPGQAPPVKDCGTKTVDWKLSLYYDYVKKTQLRLEGNNTPDPFTNCSGPGGFPYFIGDGMSKGRAPVLPADELFNDDYGQIVVLGKAKTQTRDPEYTSDGKLQWNIDFRRVKGVHPKP